MIAGLTLSGFNPVKAQYRTPAILDSVSMEAQLAYIQKKTRIYDNFRAIREDVFQKMKKICWIQSWKPDWRSPH